MVLWNVANTPYVSFPFKDQTGSLYIQPKLRELLQIVLMKKSYTNKY
jgi:hypothetical protein